jgi:hypothetical protein
MSSNIDRLRARMRRHNERQAQSADQPAPRRAELAPLGLNEGQGAAIKKALADASASEATVRQLLAERKLTLADLERLTPGEIPDFAAAVRRYEERAKDAPPAKQPPVAPPGNAPGEYPGQGDQGTATHTAPEHNESTPANAQGAESQPTASLSAPVSPVQPEPAPLPAAPAGLAMSATANGHRVEFPKSSNIQSAEVDNHGVLTVAFQGGQRYRYSNFSVELLREWSEAKSAGAWFTKNIRNRSDRHPVIKD